MKRVQDNRFRQLQNLSTNTGYNELYNAHYRHAAYGIPVNYAHVQETVDKKIKSYRNKRS